MVARLFIASLVTVFAMVVALTAVVSIRQYGTLPTDFIGVVVLIAAWLIAGGVVARARRRRIRTGAGSV
jgi:hypothetical protein